MPIPRERFKLTPPIATEESRSWKERFWRVHPWPRQIWKLEEAEILESWYPGLKNKEDGTYWRENEDALWLPATFSHRNVWQTHPLSSSWVWGDIRREGDLLLSPRDCDKHILSAQGGEIQPPTAQIWEYAGGVLYEPCDHSPQRDLQMFRFL